MKQYTGYHGTSINSANEIIKSNFKLSGKKEWFGFGIYFFEDKANIFDGREEAKNWAIQVKKIPNWAVIRALIEAKNIIDLVQNEEHRQYFEEIKEKLLEKHKNNGKNVKDFKENTIFHKMEKENLDLIRCLVDGSRGKEYNSYVVNKPQIQICVKKLSCIKQKTIIDKGE